MAEHACGWCIVQEMNTRNSCATQTGKASLGSSRTQVQQGQVTVKHPQRRGQTRRGEDRHAERNLSSTDKQGTERKQRYQWRRL